jgi:tetratricopeptide (TPR) repeat protein
VVKLAGPMVKIALAALMGACLSATVWAQEPAPPPPAPSQEQKEPAADPAAKPKSDQPVKPPGTVDAEAPSPRVSTDKNEVYDPYHAAKSIEVGKYYMRKGDTDAAIDRFKDAIHYKFDFAEPRILLAHAYEKKHEDAEAIRYYKEYLKILPNGPDAKHARERIEKLSKNLNAKD